MSPDISPVLALDSSGAQSGLALFRDGQTLHASAEFGRDVDAYLAEFVAQKLSVWGLEFQDLKGLLVVVGPGGFAGLRISVSYMRGLAVGLDLPIYGISSLEAQVGSAPLPPFGALPARRRDPDKSWWVQKFVDPNNIEIRELDTSNIQALANAESVVFDPNKIHEEHDFAERAIAWWQAGRGLRAGAEAAFVRSAFR